MVHPNNEDFLDNIDNFKKIAKKGIQKIPKITPKFENKMKR